MEEYLAGFADTYGANYHVFLSVMRWLAPLIALLLLLRCAKSLLTFRREPEIWAWLCLRDGKKIAITHWETVIGRSKRSDIVIPVGTVSRSHAVLTRYDDGSWSITDADSREGVLVNGKKIAVKAIKPKDVISIGGVEMNLQPISPQQEQRLTQLRTRASGTFSGTVNLLLLSLFQVLCCMGFLMNAKTEYAVDIAFGFGGILVCQWLLFLFYLSISRTAFELETLAFFLCTMGMAAISSVKPWEITKQFTALGIGLVTYLLVGWSLRDLERVKKVRYLAAAAGLGFLLITLVFGTEYYGAKNWLIIGPLSIQPSELSKVCFVYMGAATMDRLLKKRNRLLFILYSAAICGCLALMNDFGTALVFFFAFVVIAYLRSGSVGTITLACASVGFAGVLVLEIAPHALRRFAAWRHIWETPLTTGYQQTRALMCIASGGLFGLGIGQGWMGRVFSADSDVVFATVSEEWGLVMAMILVVCTVVPILFSVRSAAVARSSFYTIAACTASGILLLQVVLNVLGTVDLLPLTGITFPFVSNGGSSMICAWGLLAFVKAADTRQNASFAVPLIRRDANE